MHSIESLLQDARYALRALRTNRGVATLVAAALALAIGANTAIFTITNALILRSLPVKDPEHLVNVRVGNFMSWGYIEAEESFTYGLWQQLLRHQDVLSDFFAYADWRFDAVLNDETKAVNGAFATAPMFRTLGIQAVIGRIYNQADEENARAVPVAVISYGVWQREFGSDPGAVGRTVVIEGKPFTILGVLPSRFFGLTVGRMADFYLPLEAEPYVRGKESAQLDALRYCLQVFGRLRPEVTTAQANARLGALAAIAMQATVPSALPERERPTYLKQTFVLAPGQWGISYVRAYLERPLAVLSGVVALLLLLACFTVANLMLAMATARQREFAVRIALGASRGRIVRQLALESGSLALIGGVAGLVVARAMSDLLVRAYSRNSDPLFLTLTPDWRVFGFALLTAGFSAVLFGLTPALRSARVEPAESLKTGSATVSAGVLRARRYLLAAQLAVTVVLVSGAVLFGETLRQLLTEKAGFNSDRVLIADVDLRRTRVAKDDRLRYYSDLLDRMRMIPSIDSAAASYVAPISGSTWQFNVNAETGAGAKPIHIYYNAVSPDFLRLFGTRVLAGRGFTKDDKHGAPLVALVNQTLARAAFGDGQAIGKRMSMLDPEPRAVDIVGIVQDVKYRNLREAVPPTLYAAFDQFKEPPASISISMRSNSPVEGVVREVSRILSHEYPDLSFTLTPFSAQINDSMVLERAFAAICSMFGVLALGLAAIGLYGVLSYMIERRRPEFGIRMALGASPRDVRRMIYGQSFATCAAGVAIGCLLAAWASRFARAMLFGVSGVEPRMYAVVVGVLAVVAFIATVVPAIRASRTQPMQVLRSE